MDSITLLITALSVGITTMEQTVQNDYQKFKLLLNLRYPDIDIDILESRPTSDARKAVIREELEQTEAVADTELLYQAQILLHSAEKSASLDTTIAGVSLAQIQAGASILIEDIAVQSTGTNSTYGVQVTDATSDKDFIIRDITVDATDTVENSSQTTQPPTQILFLAANPVNLQPLKLAEESRLVEQALRRGPYGRSFQVVQNHALQITDIQELLLAYQPDIVHFAGHSSEEGSIFLQDKNNQARSVSTAALGRLFGSLSHYPKCVVLNGCYSIAQADEITRHVGCMIGANAEIEDAVAQHFAGAFYCALAFGESVASAFSQAIATIDLQGLGQTNVPQLISGLLSPNDLTFV